MNPAWFLTAADSPSGIRTPSKTPPLLSIILHHTEPSAAKHASSGAPLAYDRGATTAQGAPRLTESASAASGNDGTRRRASTLPCSTVAVSRYVAAISRLAT